MKDTDILICFCKHPEPGLAKSRLAKTIGDTKANNVYKKLLEHTLETLKQINITSYLYCFPNTHNEVLQKCSDKYGIPLYPQADGDLGKKMFIAIQEHINNNANVVLIGTDCPNIDANYIKQAFGYLRDDYDVILGPAVDGGYVLIGANKVDISVFNNVSWSTSLVLEQTIKNIVKLGWKHKCLSTMRDLDDIEDYEYYLELNKFKHLFNSL